MQSYRSPVNTLVFDYEDRIIISVGERTPWGSGITFLLGHPGRNALGRRRLAAINPLKAAIAQHNPAFPCKDLR